MKKQGREKEATMFTIQKTSTGCLGTPNQGKQKNQKKVKSLLVKDNNIEVQVAKKGNMRGNIITRVRQSQNEVNLTF